MKKVSINSEITSLNNFSAIFMGIIFISCLIYNIIIQYLFGIISFTLILTFLYVIFYRKIFFSENVEFDQDFIYFNDKQIEISKIEKITKSEIYYKLNDELHKIIINVHPLEKNLDKLIEIHKKTIYNNVYK